MTLTEDIRLKLFVANTLGYGTPYILQETGIDRATLWRFMNGGSINIEKIERLYQWVHAID